MSRPSKPAYDLTDAEKRDLTQLIAQGRPLPEKYRFIIKVPRGMGIDIFGNDTMTLVPVNVG